MSAGWAGFYLIHGMALFGAGLVLGVSVGQMMLLDGEPLTFSEYNPFIGLVAFSVLASLVSAFVMGLHRNDRGE